MGEDEIEHLKTIFETLDKNHDGVVSLKELKKGLSSVKSTDVPANLSELMDSLDVNGSRRIDYTEFLAATLDARHHEEEGICWTAFQHFDRDGNGVITRAELDEVLHDEDVAALMSSDTSTMVAQSMEEFDIDKDGVIDFEEFMAMMRGVDSASVLEDKMQREAERASRAKAETGRENTTSYR